MPDVQNIGKYSTKIPLIINNVATRPNNGEIIDTISRSESFLPLINN